VKNIVIQKIGLMSVYYDILYKRIESLFVVCMGVSTSLIDLDVQGCGNMIFEQI